MFNIFVMEDNYVHRNYICNSINNFSYKSAEKINMIPVLDPLLFYEKSVKKVTSSDIFFIDINLNAKINGIDLANKIRYVNKFCKIIFITSFSNRSIEVMNANILPFGYLVKETDLKNLDEQIHTILNKIFMLRENSTNLISLRTTGESIFLFPKDINYFETYKQDRYHSYVQTIDEEYTLSEKFSHIKKIFTSNTDFIMLKSYVINTSQIQSINYRLGILSFKSRSELYLSNLILLKIKKFIQNKK